MIHEVFEESLVGKTKMELKKASNMEHRRRELIESKRLRDGDQVGRRNKIFRIGYGGEKMLEESIVEIGIHIEMRTDNEYFGIARSRKNPIDPVFEARIPNRIRHVPDNDKKGTVSHKELLSCERSKPIGHFPNVKMELFDLSSKKSV